MSGLWIPPDAEAANADLDSQHIEGIATHGSTPFSVGLISQIDENLWTGGCINGVVLPSQFRFLVSLYPWESYRIEHDLDAALVVRLFDAVDMPDLELLRGVAAWINVARKIGPTLVHCQAGLNRSGLTAALALILDGMSPADAIALLREKRCEAVLCNSTFEQWLLSLRGVAAA